MALRMLACSSWRRAATGGVNVNALACWQHARWSATKEGGASPEKDKFVTVPNALCVSRIAAAPVLVHLITHNNFHWAAGLFGYAAFTDMLDGWIARNIPGQASKLGSFLDPLADKVLVATLFVSLAYVDVIPMPLVALAVSRDLLLLFAGFYIRYMSVAPPFTLKKYLDMSMPLAEIRPTLISKANTLVQLSLIGTALVVPIFQMQDNPLFHGLCMLTGATTFASAVSYLVEKNTYRFSNREYDHQGGKKLTAFVIFVLFNAGFSYNYYYSDSPKTKIRVLPNANTQ